MGEYFEGIRLNKYISDAGFCSRREADRLIERGLVQVNGIVATMGMRVRQEQEIVIDGKPLAVEKEEILLAVNKPRGIVCTTKIGLNETSIVEFLKYPKRIYPIGRLDKDSEGLILMTNQGNIVNDILRGSNCHEKEYTVKVNREITEEFLDKIRTGIPILNTITKPCIAEKLSRFSFRIILTQGLNRQIRRMCEYCGYRVEKLVRIRIMNIMLGDLPKGKYRPVTEEEKQELFQQLYSCRQNGKEGKEEYARKFE